MEIRGNLFIPIRHAKLSEDSPEDELYANAARSRLMSADRVEVIRISPGDSGLFMTIEGERRGFISTSRVEEVRVYEDMGEFTVKTENSIYRFREIT